MGRPGPVPRPEGGRPPTPTWVKGIAIIGLLLLVSLVILLLTGHGPGRHGP